jgi:hypothetical protein
MPFVFLFRHGRACPGYLAGLVPRMLRSTPLFGVVRC